MIEIRDTLSTVHASLCLLLNSRASDSNFAQWPGSQNFKKVLTSSLFDNFDLKDWSLIDSNSLILISVHKMSA